MSVRAGSLDLERARTALAVSLPPPLAPLARLAYDYRWSWMPGAAELFRAIHPDRWELCRGNPVRLLAEAGAEALARAAADPDLVGRAVALEAQLVAERAAGPAPDVPPVAFLCAEFGVHGSLPIYSGGLGVLAGDILKAASDLGRPLVGVGLLYRQGYFHQRLDASGWQHEWYVDSDVERLPIALVTGDGGEPLRVRVPIYGHEVTAQIWRADVGRVPLYLLDTNRPENGPVDRWITARLYVGDRELRLAQYLLLGIGGVRALRALGIDFRTVHLNEGHAAFAPLELAREGRAAGASFPAALAAARARTVFTSHTPVAAGNESYTPAEVLGGARGLIEQLGISDQDFLALGRTHPGDPDERFGLTTLALHTARSANGVSRRHGEVARAMWHVLWPGRRVEDIPIGHVTNGVHHGTWTAGPMRALLTRHLGAGWESRAGTAETWAAVAAIPDEELWAVRNQLRARLVDEVRARSVADRLARGDARGYVDAAARTFDPAALTVGFARRLATYKRVYLVSSDPARSIALLSGPKPLQIVISGKAHPLDDDAKRVVQQQLFPLRHHPHVGSRVAYLEDYDMALAAELVSGCDVWVNLPRPPLEASGTSGMKAAMNGGLNLSVLDGWWAEAYDGTNGWGWGGEESTDLAAQDARDATRLYDLLQNEVIPLFYDRGDDGIPHGWLAQVKRSLLTLGGRFGATRMVEDYRHIHDQG